MAAAAALEGVVVRGLKGVSLSCPQNFVQLEMLMGNCVQLDAVREPFESAAQAEGLRLTFQLAAGFRAA